jgi:predicted metal-dependent hydrolase
MTSDLKTQEERNLLTAINFNRSARAKHLRITLRPDRTVTVTVPRHVSMAEACDFLRSKKEWLAKNLLKMEQHNQTMEHPALKDIDLVQAQKELFERLDAFSEKLNLPYNRAAFRCQKTRWGSCSGKNNINLNINIAFLPRHLQDYVLLHELIHTRIKNHSPKFWYLLDTFCNNRAKLLAQELKQQDMKLLPNNT